MHIRLATRGSALALTQSRWVAARLTALCPEVSVDLVIVKTEGDADQTRPLSAIGGRGVFVKAIEDALLAGEADFAVHSLKDMPSELPAGLVLAAIPEREDPRDVLVLPRGRGSVGAVAKTADRRLPTADRRPAAEEEGDSSVGEEGPLPVRMLMEEARVGTSGPRRRAVLRYYRPDLRIVDVRGNLDTRLRKLDTGEYDALMLAAAGLRRLGLGERISIALETSVSVPAVGQGALGVEARQEDDELRERLALLDHAPTRVQVTAERAALSRLGAGCTLPFGAHATIEGDRLVLQGVVSDVEGRMLIREEAVGPISDPLTVGRRLAEALLAAGGEALLAGCAPSEERRG